MVSFTLVLTSATLAVLAAASPASRALKLRQDDCQGVRDAIASNNWPCNEVAPSSCEFCCAEWLNLAGAYGDPPCHEDHGDFECPAGSAGYHCGADPAK
ncbi:hypothetical protein C8A01DRAFT_38269 [Parachaetomium inaequale]|uniref:Uncharacterized protein n=1 Tax=Parachaetomium inaequale TaxID=2588326 RepID=A0AAN6SPS4_9PEZI|nr:hypothetical protein C8A01DRAFT_38269 [Parachaetomium inaequale]